MKIGITMFATDLAMDPVELACEAEARGFYSLYIPEHTHIPTSRRTPPPTGDAVLAEEYKRTLDPYIALAAASARTERIRLGTGIGLVAQHDPITFAKELATLDLLSRGRLVLGIGYGWNHEEMENHGVDVKRRREVVRETMLAMQALWTQEVASFSGEFVRFEPSWQWPKPCSSRARACCSAVRRVRSCSDTSPSTATAGCRSAGLGSPQPSSSCERRSPPRAGIPHRSTSCRWACCRARRSSTTTASTALPNRCCASRPRRATR
jgi:probable F420-dependent oxidoreductase